MASIDDLCATLEKELGKNAERQSVTRFINTGYPPLNKTISGHFDGGLPFGRIIEMYSLPSHGKTALATQWMAQAQKMGGIAIFIDWERSFDVELAKGFGLNDERPYWLYAQPDTWEKGNIFVAKACKLIRDSKAIPDDAPILCVFDSVASAVPQSMTDKEIDEYTMNDTTALARVASTTLKSMAQHAANYDATFLYLNQVRTKPGVVYGDPMCLRGNVKIPFVDGTSATMKEIVDNKIDKEVWSYNESTGKLEPSKIVGWFNNGKAEDMGKKWIHIRALSKNKNGVSAITATNDHKILVKDKGWINAESIVVGDELISSRIDNFDGSAKEFISAVLCFDAHVESPHRTASICLEDNNDPLYVQWKVEKLSKHLDFNKTCFKTKFGAYDKYRSKFTAEISELAKQARNPILTFKNGMTPLQLAIAVMDDGNLSAKNEGRKEQRYSISFKRFKGDEDALSEIGDIFYRSFGLTYSIHIGEGLIRFDESCTKKIAEIICKFVPECMSRKLPLDYQNKYVDFELSAPANKVVVEYAPVTEVREGGKKVSTFMYDIEVEKNHNFMAGSVQNGFIVHNCTPGGVAMEFYATVRMHLSRKKLTDNTKQFIGQSINIKCTKSKLTRPFQECALDMVYDDLGVAHFDAVGSTLNYLIDEKIVKTAGPRVVWTDGKNYWRKDLLEKINSEGGLEILMPMLPH